MGFAPNPFHGVCTLATCKPKARRYMSKGDYVIGTGSKPRRLNGHLVYIMRIGEVSTFSAYWSDPRFARKKPVMNGSVAQRYGDNVYYRSAEGLPWIQADSFHSLEGGVNLKNLSRDTDSTDRVLIGDWFMYWGELAPKIPAEFLDFVHTTQGEIIIKDEVRIAAFVAWASSQGEANCVLGDPIEWAYEEKRARKQGYVWVP